MTPRAREFLISPMMPLASLAATLLLTFILFLFLRPNADGRVFFYPDNAGVTIGSERRCVPGRKALEEKITVFIEELFLGPIDLHLSPAVPEGTSLNHVAVIEKKVYIDIGGRMLKTDGGISVSFDEALENIRHNILFNFPRIDEVVFTIDGNQVHAPYYAGYDAID